MAVWHTKSPKQQQAAAVPVEEYHKYYITTTTSGMPDRFRYLYGTMCVLLVTAVLELILRAGSSNMHNISRSDT